MLQEVPKELWDPSCIFRNRNHFDDFKFNKTKMVPRVNFFVCNPHTAFFGSSLFKLSYFQKFLGSLFPPIDFETLLFNFFNSKRSSQREPNNQSIAGYSF